MGRHCCQPEQVRLSQLLVLLVQRLQRRHRLQRSQLRQRERHLLLLLRHLLLLRLPQALP
jgi:hypothetical protein